MSMGVATWPTVFPQRSRGLWRLRTRQVDAGPQRAIQRGEPQSQELRALFGAGMGTQTVRLAERRACHHVHQARCLQPSSLPTTINRINGVFVRNEAS
jgi:hypothetical protein